MFFWGGNYECVNTSVGFISLGIHFLSRFVNWWIFQSWLKLLVVLICIYVYILNKHRPFSLYLLYMNRENKVFYSTGRVGEPKIFFVFMPECFFWVIMTCRIFPNKFLAAHNFPDYQYLASCHFLSSFPVTGSVFQMQIKI